MINRKFQEKLMEPTYVDWEELLKDQESGLYEILDRLAKAPVLERDWKPLLTFRKFFILTAISISSVAAAGLRRPSVPPGSKTPLQNLRF